MISMNPLEQNIFDLMRSAARRHTLGGATSRESAEAAIATFGYILTSAEKVQDIPRPSHAIVCYNLYESHILPQPENSEALLGSFYPNAVSPEEERMRCMSISQMSRYAAQMRGTHTCSIGSSSGLALCTNSLSAQYVYLGDSAMHNNVNDPIGINSSGDVLTYDETTGVPRLASAIEEDKKVEEETNEHVKPPMLRRLNFKDINEE